MVESVCKLMFFNGFQLILIFSIDHFFHSTIMLSQLGPGEQQVEPVWTKLSSQLVWPVV